MKNYEVDIYCDEAIDSFIGTVEVRAKNNDEAIKIIKNNMRYVCCIVNDI